MPHYKPRQSYVSYDVYIKKRETTCHYNRGLYWMDKGLYDKGILEFQKAICADPYNEDAKYQLHILESHYGVPPDVVAAACMQTIDCSGCQYINAKKN